jgi:hypothetical protein
LTSGKKTVKVIARAKLAEVNFCTISSLTAAIDVSVSRVFLTFVFPSQLNEEENREDVAASPEGSTSVEDSSDSGERNLGSDSSSRVAAATRTAATDKLPGAMTILQRWMSRIKRFVRTLHTLRGCLYTL